MLFPLYYPLPTTWLPSRLGAKTWQYAIVISTATSFAWFLIGLSAIALKKRNPHTGPFVLATIAVGLIAGNGTSAGIGEISCFLGLGLFLATLMSLKTDLFIGKAILLFFGFSFVGFLTSKKYDAPYAWWLMSQPTIRGELSRTDIPQLKGFRLSKGTIQIFEEVKKTVEENTSENEHILAFPHMPIFYLLSNRWPNSMAIVHWFDFLPDNKAKLEAARIQQDPPKVIIDMDIPESVWAAHERLFRHGKPMGQRDIKAVINKLTKNPGKYKLEREYPLNDGCILNVWVQQAVKHPHSKNDLTRENTTTS